MDMLDDFPGPDFRAEEWLLVPQEDEGHSILKVHPDGYAFWLIEDEAEQKAIVAKLLTLGARVGEMDSEHARRPVVVRPVDEP